jgi:hypothetical protein
MKKLSFVILLSVMLLSQAFAQEAYFFMSKIPPLPGNACSMDSMQQRLYKDDVNQLLQDLSDAISPRKKAIKTDVENSREQIEKNMAQQYGLSNADIQKLKNKELSKEEKKAIADKMLQEKTGISMDEVEDLKKMSKEGKKAWAEGYSAQQMANAMPNADGGKTEEQIEMEKEQVKNKKMFDLLQEQKLITDRIHASNIKYVNRMRELDKEDSVALWILAPDMKPLLERLNEMGSPSDEENEEAKSIRSQLRKLEMVYCEKLTPHLIDIIGDCLTDLHKFMPDYKRLEEITAELSKTMPGINKDFSSPGLFQLEAVKSYVELLRHTFKYKNPATPKIDYDEEDSD